jgi:hypothetical protein
MLKKKEKGTIDSSIIITAIQTAVSPMPAPISAGWALLEKFFFMIKQIWVIGFYASKYGKCQERLDKGRLK